MAVHNILPNLTNRSIIYTLAFAGIRNKSTEDMIMRTEATIEEWRRLYDLSDRFFELKPWELLDNLELVVIRFSEDDYATFSVMGSGG